MTPIRRSTQAGRRGVTRNLVGRESVARVRIPSPPPEKSTCICKCFFQLRVPSGTRNFICATAQTSRCRRHHFISANADTSQKKSRDPYGSREIYIWGEELLLQGLLNSNGHGDGHTDHGVVTSVGITGNRFEIVQTAQSKSRKFVKVSRLLSRFTPSATDRKSVLVTKVVPGLFAHSPLWNMNWCCRWYHLS